MKALSMAKVHDIRRHPSRVLASIRAYSTDLDKVAYQSETINSLVKEKKVFMTEIWECLESGEIMEEHMHFELDGTYAKLVCHTGDWTIYLDLKIVNAEDKLLILFATREDN
jgi:hypothetical protein